MRRGGERTTLAPGLLLFLHLFLAPTVAAQRVPEPGVPLGRWHVRDGSSTRLRTSFEKVRVDQLEVVWSRALDGRLATEMLSWDESFFALVSPTEGELRLRRFSVEDGALAAETSVPTGIGEPGMSVWGRRIVLSLPGAGLRGFSIADSGFVPDWRLDREGDLSSPILEGRELFLREGARVVCYEWRQESPRWRSEEGYIGDFAISGDELLAIREGSQGLSLDILDRDSGRRLSSTPLPRLQEREVGARPFVQANGKLAAVRVPGTWVSPSGRTQNTVVLRWPEEKGKPLAFEAYVHQVATPVLSGTELCYLDDVGTVGGGLYLEHDHLLAPLALRDRNPEFFGGGGTILYTRGYCWLGGSAFRGRDLAIRRMGGDERLHSAITALDTILFGSEAGDRVTALREPLRSTRPPPAMTLAEATAVISPDEILAGAVTVDPEQETVTCRDRSGAALQRPVDRLLVIVDREGLVRFTPSELALMRGLRALGRHDNSGICLELAAESAGAGLPDELALYLDRALDHGIDMQVLEPLQASLRQLRQSPRRIEPGAREKIIARRELRAQANSSLYWRRMSRHFEADPETGKGPLRDWLHQYDEHEAAIEWVRAQIPEGLRPKGALKPSEWLEFLIAEKRAPVAVVDAMPARASMPRNRRQKALETARAEWREDLIGVECGGLLVITPRQDPSRIANCLVVGQMVCGELERLFGRPRRSDRLLEIHLFESQEDFVRFGLKQGFAIAGAVAGYYSPRENISRLFVPGEEELLFDVLDVLVHELTHHWMESLSPLVPDWKAFRLRKGAGAFVVEGLAVMMEELDYDPERAEVRTDPRRFWCLDFVANCPEDRLIPWKTILEWTQFDYARMMARARPIEDLDVPATWSLLRKPDPSQATIYYAQVGALVTYLMRAEDGRHRERLFELVGRYYRGSTERLDIEKFLRLDAEALGPAIRAWARETVRPGP